MTPYFHGKVLSNPQPCLSSHCLASIVREVICGAIRTTGDLTQELLAVQLKLHAPHAMKVDLIF